MNERVGRSWRASVLIAVVLLSMVGCNPIFAGTALVPGNEGDGGRAVDATLAAPSGFSVDPAGNTYIADTGNDSIRRVDTDGIITTVAGTGERGYSGDGGPAIEARFFLPTMVVWHNGSLYVADRDNDAIRQIGPDGIVRTIAGGQGPGFVDGPLGTNKLRKPRSITFDGTGRLWFTDRENHAIRRITQAGSVVTVAGNGSRGFSGDGGPASLAQLQAPRGIFRHAGSI